MMTVTDDMVETAWAAIVGGDIAKTCFNASIIRADLKTGLTAALASPLEQPASPLQGREIERLREALETAAGRFNMMSGVGLVNGADPKVGYRECMEALSASPPEQPASPLRGLIPVGKQARFKSGVGEGWFGVSDFHDNPDNFEYRTVYIPSESLTEQPDPEMFKCNCPFEVRSGCSEPRCPHYVKPCIECETKETPMSHAIDGSVPYDLAGRLRSQEETKAWLEERKRERAPLPGELEADAWIASLPDSDERREGEGMTEFTMRKIRNEIIEECAKVAGDTIPSIQLHYGVAETVGALIAARRIRELKR